MIPTPFFNMKMDMDLFCYTLDLRNTLSAFDAQKHSKLNQSLAAEFPSMII